MCIPKVTNKAILAALSISLMGLGHAANATVVLLSEFRSIDASASVATQTESSTKSSPGDFSDFDDLVEASVSISDGSASASAQQSSQISATSILASGEATASAELTIPDPTFTTAPTGNARSFLSVTFELTTPYLFDLSGMLGSSSLSGVLSSSANVSLSNNEGSFNLFLSTPSFGNDETTPINLSGTLLPDIYFLEASADITATAFEVGAESGSSNFSLNLQFSPVPIPASLLLFGSGLLGLIGIARRKKAA